MVSKKSVLTQLKKLEFNHRGWGTSEVNELHNILLPDEQILELANGFYEAGFALLVSTDIRVLLIDKKPLNYLTVEDLRFDMINEIDYSHRLLGAQISIATGSKNLRFNSLNQARLRKLIGHVQHSMAEVKRKASTHQEGQVQHLERINEQLQKYLLAQQDYQQQVQAQQQSGHATDPLPPPVKPSPELADYLYAQSLMAQYQQQMQAGQASAPPVQLTADQVVPLQAQAQSQQPPAAPAQEAPLPQDAQLREIYNEGVKEIFGNHLDQPPPDRGHEEPADSKNPLQDNLQHLLEINPFSVAYSKLPMAMRNRKFGRPSWRAHSAAEVPKVPEQPVEV